MDIRFSDEVAQQRELFDRLSMRLNTSIPGQVVSFDETTRLATVVPAIYQKTYVDGITSYQQQPNIENVPVYFPFSSVSGFSLTFPVKAGDPCLLVFSQRAIDNWLEFGGVQLPEDGISCRHHDISDGFALVGFSSLADSLDDFQTTAIEIRNRDRSVCVTVSDTQAIVKANTSILTIANDGSVTLEGDTLTVANAVTFNGAVTFKNTAEFDEDASFKKKINNASNIKLAVHRHKYGSNLDTGVPE